jgi:hypothetical protein
MHLFFMQADMLLWVRLPVGCIDSRIHVIMGETTGRMYRFKDTCRMYYSRIHVGCTIQGYM